MDSYKFLKRRFEEMKAKQAAQPSERELRLAQAVCRAEYAAHDGRRSVCPWCNWSRGAGHGEGCIVLAARAALAPATSEPAPEPERRTWTLEEIRAAYDVASSNYAVDSITLGFEDVDLTSWPDLEAALTRKDGT